MIATVSNSPLGEMMSYGGRKRSRRSTGLLIGGGVTGLALIALFLWPSQQISQRPHDMKTTRVVLPPPPPPPPPPEPKPIEQPAEPVIAPPIEQPQDTPPPPDQANSDPTPGDSALTAREGAGPSNYGLAVGDGGGTRIGGRPGGSGFGGFNRAAYASYLQGEIRRAVEADRDLRSSVLRTGVRVWIDSAGRITRVEAANSDKDAAIRKVLLGRSVRPPDASLAMPVSLSLDIRRGG